MFDFGLGSTELLFIAVVAIIVVGPKDLPRLLRTIGKFTTKIRSLAREFHSHLDDAAREAGLDEVKKDLSKATQMAGDFSTPDNDFTKAFESATSELKGDPIKDSDSPSKQKKTVSKKGNSTRSKASNTETSSKTASGKPPAKKTTSRKPVVKKTAARKPAVSKATTKKKPVRTKTATAGPEKAQGL